MFGLFNSEATYPLTGVDFGSQTIKAVTLSGNLSKLRIDSVAEIPTPKGTLVDYQLQDIDRVSQSIKTLKRLISSHGEYAATAATGSKVITKVIQIEASVSDKELESRVKLEAEQIIPFPLDEVSLDFEVLGNTAGSPGRVDVLLSAARTESITGQVGALADAGFTVKVVDVRAHALGRGVVACLPALQGNEHPVGVIDIGASTMTFATLIKGEVVYYRLQNFGGDNYNQAVASFYGMTFEEAEQAKIRGTLPAGYESDVLLSYINSLLQHVRRQAQLFYSSSGYREIDKLVLTGGGSLLPGLQSHLQKEFSCEVLQPDPFVLFGCAKGKAEGGHGTKYMAALGLALRSFTPCQI